MGSQSYVVYRTSPFRAGVWLRIAVRLLAVAALVGAVLAVWLLVSDGSGGGAKATLGKGATAAAKPPAKATGAKATSAGAKKTTAKASTAKRHRAQPPLPTAAKTPVLVLNANGVHGAAADMAARLQGFGYPVPSVGNSKRSGLPTAIEYTHGFGPAAQALARKLGGVGVVVPLDGLRVKDLHGAALVVIVGS
jgi:hypothetical protein